MQFRYIKSRKHYLKACKYVAGGVSSNARLMPGTEPVCLVRGRGPRVYDIDGNEYLDYVLALGPLILGHCPPNVMKAANSQLEFGSMFGSAVVGEEKLARAICGCFPSVHLVSFTNSASEAVHMAIRLAKAFTGRERVVKFEGCYHGWIDNIMVSVHPPYEATICPEDHPKPLPDGAGQSKCSLSEVIVATWNGPELVEDIFRKYGNDIAALILEPIPCNNGVIPPEEGFLSFLRDLTHRYESVLIFDETITGFRVHVGGAQAYYGVMPDLTVFGKALGGGFPIAGFGGAKEIMDLITVGKVVRAGTYNSNPLCVAAANAVLGELNRDNGAAMRHITKTGNRLMEGVHDIFKDHGIPLTVQGPGSIFSTFFSAEPVRTYRDTQRLNGDLFHAFWKALMRRGVRISPTHKGLWFLSAAHSTDDVELTLKRVDAAVGDLRSGVPINLEGRAPKRRGRPNLLDIDGGNHSI
jgi:glutamate-1-semialdehyde 2,1-aminomutase